MRILSCSPMSRLCIMVFLFITLTLLFGAYPFLNAQTLTVQDDIMQIDFNRRTGAISGLHYKTQDVPFRVNSVKLKPLFELKTMQAMRDWTAPADCVKSITSDDASVKSFLLAGNGRSLEMEFYIEPGIMIVCTISLADAGQASFGMKILNAVPSSEGSRALRILSVKYPQISGLQHGTSGNDDYLAYPVLQGDLVSNPVKNARYIKKIIYGHQATMTWMDLHTKDCGLYFGSHEKRLYALDVIPEVDQASQSLTFAFEKTIMLCPGEEWNSGPYIVAMHKGDWHRGAEIYRAWKDSYLSVGEVPRWARECDGWLGTGSQNYTYANLPDFLNIAKWMGLSHLQIWAQMTKGKTSYYCYFLPDPTIGGEEGIKNAVREVNQRGGTIGFYTNGITFDMNIATTLKNFAYPVPDGFPIPVWFGKFEFFNTVHQNGEFGHSYSERYHGNHGEGYNAMCPSSGWADYLAGWVERYHNEYGVNSHYLDTFPYIAYGAGPVCYNLNHADRPHALIQGYWDAYTDILRRTNDPEFMLLSEFPSDVVIDKSPISLGWETMGTGRPFRHPEIFTYTYPEWIFFSGTCNRQDGVAEYYDDMTYDMVRGEDSIDRTFLNGFRFDLLPERAKKANFNRANAYNNPYAIYVKKMIELRKKIKNDLYYSKFRDQIGLGSLPEKVEARIWAKRDGSALTINLLDRRQNKEPFAFSLNLDDVGFRKVTAVTVHKFSGEASQPEFQVQNNILKFTVPERMENCAAISIK